ncbi:MAG: phosphoadenosine phosphosulfate reductase, partial [Alteraurantiacibacter sp.]
REQHFPLHDAYTRYDATRLSCSYCVLTSLHNLEMSSRCEANVPAYRRIVDLEIASGFSFQPGRWLADVSPHLLTDAQVRALPHAKRFCEQRRKLEGRMPSDLRFRRGWPPRVPDTAEAGLIAEARAHIIRELALDNAFPTADAIRARFSELHQARH